MVEFSLENLQVVRKLLAFWEVGVVLIVVGGAEGLAITVVLVLKESLTIVVFTKLKRRINRFANAVLQILILNKFKAS